MAIPTSPSVVVLENDVSIYTPNINSSVVGVVGFANKGPVDIATLITSQEGLIRVFGKPSTEIPGQGLEGALEILEATNQLYFVRAANSSKASASASIPLGVCPAVKIDTDSWNVSAASSIYYAITPHGSNTVTSSVVTLTASSTLFPTKASVFLNAFNPNLTSDQNVFGYINGTDFYLASKYAGSGATLTVSSFAGGISGTAVDASGGISTGTASSITDATGFTVSGIAMGAYAINEGTGYNLTRLNDGTTQGVSVEIDNISISDKIIVNSNGSQAELFTVDLSPSGLKFAEDLLIDDVSNNKSNYIYLNAFSGSTDFEGFPDDFGATAALPVAGNANATPRFVKLIEGTYSFAGGNSGYTTETDINTFADTTAIIGNSAARTGIHALDDDYLNISLAVIPGITDDSVQNELITLAESSKNFLALISPPYGYTSVQDAFNWMNGKSGSRTAAVNSSYAACYWPWVQVFNPFAGSEEWYDPAIFAARQCVFTDAVNDPWFAPAGYRRGRLTKPSDTELILNQGDRDALYENSINPVIKDTSTGIAIFGQKTSQRLPTALDRVNVRRLMIYIRKILLQLGKPFQFEPNDSLTWELVEETMKPFISDLLARRAIIGGAARCDNTTNTAARADRNEMWCSVTITPTKAAESVVFEVNLTSQSAVLNG